MEECSINSCKNCKYYLQHYIKQEKKFKAINCGHCINIHKNIKKRITNFNACKYWVEISKNTEIVNKSIKKAILEMAANLDEILIVLKDEIE